MKDNANRLDISGNNPAGGLNTVAGIGHDLKVAKNSGGTAVKRQHRRPRLHPVGQLSVRRRGNVAGNNNNCNAVY